MRGEQLPGRVRPAWTARGLLAVALLAPALAASGDASSAAERERFARHMLHDGRALADEGRLDASERVLRRGLDAEPDDPQLLRALARVLEATDRGAEALEVRARADALDPPPPPLADDPLPFSSVGLGVLLLPAAPDSDRLSAFAAPVNATLERRLRTRLAGSEPVRTDPASVTAAREWLDAGALRRALSVRVERVYCGGTVKDGPFSLVVLRVAAALRGAAGGDAGVVRAIVEDPPAGADCADGAAARALEAGLARVAVREMLAVDDTAEIRSAWSTPALRRLLPGIGERIDVQLDRGRALLGAGDLRGAASVFEGAARLDPEDPHVLAYREEVARTLALSQEISDRAPVPRDAGQLDPGLSPERQRTLERALADERQRRAELLAALAVLDEDVVAPSQDTLSRLQPSEARGESFGVRMARERAGGEVEARSAYAPDGSVIARYYLARGATSPLVREEDTNHDGAPDRWILYEAGARAEIYESAHGDGEPSMRFIFAPGGAPLARVEVGLDAEGRPERVFRYTEGQLVAEARDTNGDGRLDRFDRFDAEGLVDVREEDIDGDGEIDVRSLYRRGRLVRREISNPAAEGS